MHRKTFLPYQIFEVGQVILFRFAEFNMHIYDGLGVGYLVEGLHFLEVFENIIMDW